MYILSHFYGIQQCTFVCIWNPPSPPPSPRPSPPPSLLKERSEHAISLNIRNLPSDYRINPTIRVSILRYINDKLKIDLNELNIDLISVKYPGMIVGRPHTIPMKITVNSPSDINDFALSYIIQVLKDDKLQIEENLQRLSQEDMDFSNSDSELNIETYNFDDILVGDTFRPTSSPTITKVELNSAVAIEEINTSSSSIPWWTWLLVALAVIICILISCCYMNRSKDEMDEEKEQQLTMYVNDQMYENGSSNKSKSGQASVAASHRTYRTQHRSNRGGDDNMFLGQPIAASRSRQRRQPPRKVRGSDQSSRATKRSQRPRSKKHSGHRRPEEMSTATDPPEEISQALVIHTRKYDDDNQTGADPDGDKISPKKSMYASGALMEEVHRERQEKSARRKPKRRGTIEKLKSSLKWNQKYTDGDLEDEIVPYVPEPEEEYDEQYTERNQSNSSHKNSRKPPRKKSSFGDKLRASFNWRQSQQPFDDPVNDPIFSTSLQTNDLEDCPQIDLEVGSTDSPSILTNRNPGDGDLPPLDDPRRNNVYVRNSDEYEEDREYDQEKKKMKKQKKSKSHRSDRESSKKKKSGSSDRRKQGLLSSFTRRKSITWNDGGGSGDEESYNREYERDDGYSSKGS